MSDAFIWNNGHLARLADVHCSPLAHSLYYGSGVFEGIRANRTLEGPAIFRLDEHLARMQQGASLLGIDLDLSDLHKGCIQVLAESGLEDAYLRPMAFYDQVELTLDVDSLTHRVLVAAFPKTWPSNGGAPKGVRAIVSAYRRSPCGALPTLKLCGGYLSAILARREARSRGAEEALFVDEQGTVVEASSSNLFLVKAGRIIAVDHPDALPGITRETILALSGAEVRRVSLAELLDADEAFLTSTLGGVVPLGGLEDRMWAPGPITSELSRQYLDVVQGRTPAPKGWLTPVQSVLEVISW